MIRVCVIIAATYGFAACSLFQLDDLELQSCREARDCYALSRNTKDGLRSCYRCDAGRCVPHGSLAASSIESTSRPAWLSSANGGAERTLLAFGVADHGEPARGIVLENARSEQPSIIEFTDESEAASLEALSFARFGSDHLIAVGLDTMRCADGTIRVGVSTRDAPFSLQAAGDLTVYATGIDVDRTTGCTGTGRQPGARSPVVATLDSPDRQTEALAVWLAASAQGAATAPGRCSSGSSEVVAIEGLQLSLRETGSTASFAAARNPRPFKLAENALGSTPLQLVASRGPAALGYLVAYVDARGVRLRTVKPVFAGGSSATTSDAVLLEDSEADQVALSLGGMIGNEQLALVLWTSGCGADSSLRAAIYSWDARNLTSTKAPFRLRGGRSIGAPAIGYAESGYAIAQPRGAWTVLWTEDDGRTVTARASRLFEDSLEPEAPVSLSSGELLFPFVHTPELSPFAYGFATMSDGERGDLTVMACD